MLSELLEDYQEYNEDEALDEFIDLLWSSNYGLRTYKKYYTFQVEPMALSNNEELIETFEPYQSTEIQYAKTYHKDNPDSIDMIRIHINNMYMYLTNEDVYLKKEYYEEKLKPRSLYYQTIKKLKNNEMIDGDYIKAQLESSQVNAEKYKQESQLKKIKLDFNTYKELINDYIYRLFNNYKPTHEYEKEHGWELKASHDAWNEDNYVVKYFCKSLTGYMRNYVNDLKPKERYCKKCGNKLISKINNIYCKPCSNISKNEWEDKIVEYSELQMTSVNKYGNKMRIINVKNKHHLTIEFDNGYIKNNVKYDNFIKGNVKSPYDKTVYGKGYIGEGKYKSSVNGSKTKYYTLWHSMLNRCYSEKYHKRESIYKNVNVCEEWFNYQNFAKWCDENYYEVNDEIMCLDKDVLGKGLNIYSPLTCIFLPKKLNNLFISGKTRRNGLPIGVTYYKREKRYYVYCGNGSNGKVYNGSYTDIKSAFKAYKEIKEKIILQISNEYKNKIPPYIYDALINYKVEITD